MKIVHGAVAVAVVGLATISGMAQAVPVTRSANIVNHSFEDLGSQAPVPDGGQAITAVVGWSTFSSGYINPSAAQFSNEAPDGIYAARGGSLSQELDEILVAGRTYSFSIDIGRLASHSEPFLSPGYSVLLAAGSTTLGTLGRDQNGALTPGLFTTKTFSFTATEGLAGLGSKLRIQLSTNNGTPFYDNVRLTVTEDVAEVPEPAAFGLLGAGLLGVAGLRRRKR